MKKIIFSYFKKSIILYLILNIVLFSILNFSKKHENLYIQSSSSQFNSSIAYNHIINQLNFGYRVPGTISHKNCAGYIYEQVLKYSDSVLYHNFTKDSINCFNILAKLNIHKSNIVIFGAHWDSRAVAEKDPDPNLKNLPIPGANDGASGVAVLLELARVLFDKKNQINAQIWFLFLDAEDQGLSNGMYGISNWNWCEGSKLFTENLNIFYNNDENILCFILLDMVGGTNLRFIREYSYSSEKLYDDIWTIGKELGFETQFPKDPIYKTIIDDHMYFHAKNIPSIDLIIDFSSGNPYWNHHHKHSDDLINIDQFSLEVTGKTLERYIIKLFTSTNLPNYDDLNNPLNPIVYILIIIISGLGIGIFIIILIRFKKLRKINKELRIVK